MIIYFQAYVVEKVFLFFGKLHGKNDNLGLFHDNVKLSSALLITCDSTCNKLFIYYYIAHSKLKIIMVSLRVKICDPRPFSILFFIFSSL